jgi:hypothetical protein
MEYMSKFCFAFLDLTELSFHYLSKDLDLSSFVPISLSSLTRPKLFPHAPPTSSALTLAWFPTFEVEKMFIKIYQHEMEFFISQLQ